jgi:hypothetical protein
MGRATPTDRPGGPRASPPLRMDHLRWRGLRPQRRTNQRRVRADRDRPQLADQPVDVGGAELGDAGQECPLVGVRRERGRVNEYRGAGVAALFLQRQRDQVAEPFSLDGR